METSSLSLKLSVDRGRKLLAGFRHLICGRASEIVPEEKGAPCSAMIAKHLNARIGKIRETGNLEVDGGEIPAHLTRAQIETLQGYKNKQVVIGQKMIRSIETDSGSEQFFIYPVELSTIGGQLSFMAIQIPSSLKSISLGNTYIGEQIRHNLNLSGLPNMDFDKTIGDLVPNFIVIGKQLMIDQNTKGIRVDISAYNPKGNTDVIRELAKRGLTSQVILENIILAEIIKRSGIGEQSLQNVSQKPTQTHACGFKTSSPNIHSSARRVQEFFNIDWQSFIGVSKNSAWDDMIVTDTFAHNIVSCFPYKAASGDVFGGVCAPEANHHAQSGIFSLDLGLNPRINGSNIGFRPSLGVF